MVFIFVQIVFEKRWDRMINQYAKCLILLMLVGWIMGGGECVAATPYTPRHADPVQESWRWRTFPELKGQGLSCLAQDGMAISYLERTMESTATTGRVGASFRLMRGSLGRGSIRSMSPRTDVFMWDPIKASVDSRTGPRNGSFHHKGITDGIHGI